MGRTAHHDKASILTSAKRLSVGVGPRNVTIAAIGKQIGAATGSIYHRYKSRDEILAEMWLELVETFQVLFLSKLSGEEPVGAGLDAVRFLCEWIHEHPLDARLMLLHRREDFASDKWPAKYRRRAEGLAGRAAESMRQYASRLTGRSGNDGVRQSQFAIIDLPTAALKREIEGGSAPSREIERLLLDTCEYALRRAHHSHTESASRR